MISSVLIKSAGCLKWVGWLATGKSKVIGLKMFRETKKQCPVTGFSMMDTALMIHSRRESSQDSTGGNTSLVYQIIVTSLLKQYTNNIQVH